MPTVQIKDYNVLIDGKHFNDPIKSKEETWKAIEMRKNNDYTTGSLLDYVYFSDQYYLIAIELRKQIKIDYADTMQQINFIGRLERNKRERMFFTIEKTEENSF